MRMSLKIKAESVVYGASSAFQESCFMKLSFPANRRRLMTGKWSNRITKKTEQKMEGFSTSSMGLSKPIC